MPYLTKLISNTTASLLYGLCLVLASMYCYSEVHPHQGILPPYTQAPEKIDLSDQELKKLSQFKPIYKKWHFNNKQRGIAIFRVKASVDTIWSVIHNFPYYPQWINNLKEASIYERQGNHVYVKFKASHWLFGSTEWYVKHNFPTLKELPQRNWGSWQLDYRYRSDFNDSVGFWQVNPVQSHPGLSDVIYSADLKMSQNTPVFIRNSVIKRGLKSASQWVKKQSEELQGLAPNS